MSLKEKSNIEENKQHKLTNELKNQLQIYKYKCVMCGNCCRAGLEVVIEQEDTQRWIQHGRNEFSKYIQIDPKNISIDGLAGYHIEEFNVLEDMKKHFKGSDYKKRLKKLKKFILSNHEYLGEGLPLPVYSFLEELGRMPILTPKNLKIVLRGMKLGIIYILGFELSGCPFFKNNLCSIHEIKPNACRAFPYNKEGKLRIDDFFLKICKGIRKEASL